MSNIPRPQGHHVLTPSSVTSETAAVIAFVEEAFAGKLVGDSVLMLGSLLPNDAPRPANLTLYIDNEEAVTKTFARAIKAGAKSIAEPTTLPWGYHSGCLSDVGGNRWTICAIVEAVSHDEVEKRLRAAPQN